jgi:hypothetical protein
LIVQQKTIRFITCVAALAGAACTDAPTAPEPQPSLVMVATDSVVLTVAEEAAWINAHVIDSTRAPLPDAPVIRWTARDQSIVGIDEGTLGAPVRIAARANGGTWIVARSEGSVSDSTFVRVEVPAAVQQPVWRFTVASGARTTMPLSQFDELARIHIAYLNQQFNKGGTFAGRFEFVLDSVFTYSESDTASLTTLRRRPRSAQYLILYDSRSTVLSGGGIYWQDGQTIQISMSNFATSPTTSLAVAHEMGHARGAVDIYHYRLNATEQQDAYFYRPESIMEADGTAWDPLSQLLINSNAGRYPSSPDLSWTAPMFPEKIGVRVVDRMNKPVPGAEVIFHKAKGDIWGNVSPAISAKGVTDAAGVFAPAFNPFEGEIERGPQGYWCGFLGCLYLVLKVEVKHEGQSTWAFMTAAEGVVGRSRTGPTYLRKIRLGAPPS